MSYFTDDNPLLRMGTSSAPSGLPPLSPFQVENADKGGTDRHKNT
jgi:hypothetical protein